MVASIYFVRHGISRDNTEGVFSGDRDPSLEAEGYAQACKVADSLDFAPDIILSSPKIRALETARTIARALGLDHGVIKKEWLLKERSYGDLEGAKHLALDETTDESQTIMRSAGAEPLEEVYRRQQRLKDLLLARPDFNVCNVLLVGHNTSGRALRRVLSGLPFDASVDGFPNAQATRLWPV
jgi:broad specificity phosphatase PhoE